MTTLTDKTLIKSWLNQMKIKRYTINDDLSIDVDGNVRLFNKQLKDIPVQFGVVAGDFDCSMNPLNSLKGVPFEVKNNFTCSHIGLKTLDYAPHTVHQHFDCSNNLLTHLNTLETNIFGELNCSMNSIKINSYKHFSFSKLYHRCVFDDDKIKLFEDLYKKGMSRSHILTISFDEFSQRLIPFEKEHLLEKMTKITDKVNLSKKI